MTRERDWADWLVGFMRLLNHLLTAAMVLFVGWWVARAFEVIRTGDGADGHVVLFLVVMTVLVLLWLATRQFFSRAERGEDDDD